jgi:periplasmic protein TonB
MKNSANNSTLAKAAATLSAALSLTAVGVSAGLLASCSSTRAPAPNPANPSPGPAAAPVTPAPSAPASRRASNARSLDAYKRDVASAVYAANADKLHRGILPPLLRGVIVVTVVLDPNANVLEVRPMRVPSQAPETLAIVRQMLRATALPVPQQLPSSAYKAGKIEFNETFLFTDAMTYQIHSASEGQARE